MMEQLRSVDRRLEAIEEAVARRDGRSSRRRLFNDTEGASIDRAAEVRIELDRLKAILSSGIYTESDFPRSPWDGEVDIVRYRASEALYREVVLDDEAAPETRSKALKALRVLDSQERLAAEVTTAALRLFERTSEEQTRRQICHALGWHPSDAVRDMLLRAVAFDPSRHVRQAAAQELTFFRNERDVASVLRWVIENEPNQGVRAGAKRALEGRIYGVNNVRGVR